MELLHEGNALFVDEAYAAAANAYSRALQTLSKAEGAKSSSSAIVADVHAKRAAAHLKLRKLSDALADADAAIQIDSTLEMAHLRKGAYDAITWTESDDMYLKSGAQSKQQEYVHLRAERLTDQVNLARKSARRRKMTLVDFVVDLYVYASKLPVGGTQLRRATKPRIQQVSQEVSRFLEATPAAQRPHPSILAFWYFATQRARQPDGTAPELPTHITFWQPQDLDRSIEKANQQQTATERAHSSACKTIRVRINGGDVNFDFNMSDLRNALGLLDFDLRLPSSVDTTIVDVQGEDMEDADYISTI